MKVVWKFQLSDDLTVLEIPGEAKLLCVQMQEGVPTLWALVDDTQPLRPRAFGLVATGRAVPVGGVYVDTFQASPFVFHVFEVAE